MTRAPLPGSADTAGRVDVETSRNRPRPEATRPGPSFLVIGAAKCGTTTICRLLARHPDVFVSDPKEPHFFSRDECYARGWEWYRQLFEPARPGQATGEGSTTYGNPLKYPRLVGRIARDLPEVRMIYMVRNPLDRIESEWKMAAHEGWARSTFKETVREIPDLIHVSSYWRQISEYRGAFPDRQLHVVFLEDLASAPERELARCFRHIGVAPDFSIRRPDHRANRSKDYRSYSAPARWLRAAARAASLGSVAPDWARRMFHAALTRRKRLVPEWDDHTRDLVISQLGDDTRRFLRWAGKPDDFWAWK